MKKSFLLFIFTLVTSMSSQSQDVQADTTLRFQRIDRRIRPTDQLVVTVYGHDELPKVVKVEPDGTVKYPFMKDVKVDGLTLEQMAGVLAARLSQYIGGRAEVIVTYAENAEIEVIVLGQVNMPGAHKMPRNNTIQGAIAAAGGANPRSNLNETLLIRVNPETGQREEFTVAMESIVIETGDIQKLPALRDGDILFVPAIYGAVFVNVLGAVRKPGNYELFPGANLIDVIFLAGGPSDDASIRTVKLIRRVGAAQNEQIIDVESVLKAKGGQMPRLEPGDIVFVPARKFTLKSFFQVLGYVATLGTVILLILNIQNQGK